MAITVAGKNYVQLSSCDTSTSGGTWSGATFTQDADTKKEGSYALSCILKATPTNLVTFTPTSPVDLSGVKHLRMWFLGTQGGLINTIANGGVQFWVSSDAGVTKGYYYVSGKDVYPGGWINLVCDVSRDVDTGTKPASMNAINAMGFVVNLTGAGKNAVNTWFDNLIVCDGLVAYGDDAGGYFDFDDIYAVDNTPVGGGWGIIRKIGGVYFLTGSLEFGQAVGSAACKFQAKSSTVVFEDRRKDASISNVNVNLYNFTVVDNGTGTTEFILGNKAGTSGIEGCTIRVSDLTQIPKFDLVATDADISDFKLYGSIFLDADTIQLPTTGANKEVLNCSFESCGIISPSTCKVENCNVIAANDAGLQITSTSHAVKNTNIITCPYGIRFSVAGEYTLDKVMFSGSVTADIDNTSGGLVTIGLANGSNATTYTGNTAFSVSVQLTLTVTNEAGNPIVGALAYIDNNDISPYILNTTTNASGVATVLYTGSAVTGARWRVRKYGYKAYKQIIDIGGSNISIPVTLVADPQQG